ncbi:MAG: LptF/LptG family permease [Candidatus Cyclobacteriaceae bacterium M2_1C_046]
MKLLDKYILKKFLSAFFFVVLVLISVITVIDITEKTEKFVKAQVSTEQIIQYYLDYIPWMANLITPITVFIATVFVTAKLAGKTEIIAMLSSGVSFKRLLVPYLIGASIIAAISFVLTGWIIPNSNKSRLAFEIEYLKSKYHYNKSNTHLQVAPNTYLYLRSYNNQSDIGFNFTLEKLQDNQLVQKLSANRIKWMPEVNKWELSNWTLRSLDSLTQEITEGKTMDTTLALHPDDFSNDYRNYDGMTIDELNAHIDKLKFRGAGNVEVYEVEKYIRFSSPFAALILTFLGVIVSARKQRGGSGLQIAIGFFLSFVYILFFIMSKTIAEAGSLHPAFSVWIPNLTFIFISLVLYRTLPR